MLTLTHARKSFGSLVAVDDLSLEVRAGEVLGLLGPNGAGKSTTIAMITGLMRPDSGTVRLASGQVALDPADAAARRLIGFCPQGIALYEPLTGRENLEFFGRLYDLQGARLRERVDACLALVGLSDRASDRVGGYSGGMKRRLNIAAALLHDPPLILMDEPTAGVDPHSRNALFGVVETLRTRGKSLIYSTHYMEEAARLCDRVAILDHGKLLALGTVPALIAAHGGESLVRILREGEAQERTVRTSEPVRVLERELGAGGVRTATVEAPDLEAVFLALTGRTLRD
ncbi:ABC transporter ATP-binding protein [soil metagenome]